MNRLKSILKYAAAFPILLLTVFLLHPVQVHADVNDFVVTNFSGDYTLTKQDPQGELHIIETIDVLFSDFNHGVLRAIPNTYKKHKLQLHVNNISSNSGAPTEFTTYGDSGNTVLKIGDPNHTVTGSQNYVIDYTLKNVVSFYPDHGELYWDINGDQWQQPFQQVHAVFHLPVDLQLSNQSPVCYTGSFGETSQNCSVQVNQAEHTISFATTNAPLQANQTLSVVMGFQPGYFQPSTWYETLGEYTKQIILLLIMPVLVGGWAFLRWRKYGRDAKAA
jgi:uncharacterized membrane protein